MSEEELKRLEEFEQLFLHSREVCDPIEFVKRQQNLLYGITRFLLHPLYENRKKPKQDSWVASSESSE